MSNLISDYVGVNFSLNLLLSLILKQPVLSMYVIIYLVQFLQTIKHSKSMGRMLVRNLLWSWDALLGLANAIQRKQSVISPKKKKTDLISATVQFLQTMDHPIFILSEI